MFKNQLQELAQRSCFNLPSYACIREGPDHAPRFKASVNFNGEIFESPNYSNTLRQAEHAAAEVALNVLSSRGPSRSLTARVLDETGIYKNLLQETAHRAGLNLPVYTTVRSGPGHVPIFTCTVELAGMNFTGEPAKTKKQAEKNAAIAAWSTLKRLPNLDSLTNKEVEARDEQDQAVVARVLSNFRCKQVRKREHHQARRRFVRGYRDNNNNASSSSTTSNSPRYQNWRLLDLLLDSALDGSTQNQNSFMSLLPPPPPRTTSKILPPPNPSNRAATSVQVIRGQSPLKMQEIPVPLEEHQKDEEDWPSAKLDVIKKPTEKEGASNSNSSSSIYGSSSIYSPFPVSNTAKPFTESNLISRSIFGSPNPSPLASTKTSSSAHMARPIYKGGFNPHRIAPAVQIRSVIPVCAAPPPPVRPSPSSPPPPPPQPPSSSAISASPSTTTTTTTISKSTKTGAEAPSMFNQTESNSTQLSTEFNKQLQL